MEFLKGVGIEGLRIFMGNSRDANGPSKPVRSIHWDGNRGLCRYAARHVGSRKGDGSDYRKNGLQ